MTSPDQNEKSQRDLLDQQTRELVQWHFGDDTGCDFWLEKKKTFNFNPLKDVNCFDDLKKFPLFEDDWLRGCRRSLDRLRTLQRDAARCFFSSWRKLADAGAIRTTAFAFGH